MKQFNLKIVYDKVEEHITMYIGKTVELEEDMMT